MHSLIFQKSIFENNTWTLTINKGLKQETFPNGYINITNALSTTLWSIIVSAQGKLLLIDNTPQMIGTASVARALKLGPVNIGLQLAAIFNGHDPTTGSTETIQPTGQIYLSTRSQ